MLKNIWIALFFWAGVFCAGVFWTGMANRGAHAQGAGLDTAAPAPERKGLLNENNLTATGETVPHPGASQGPGTTQLDRNIEQKDDRLQNSICSNC